MATKPALFCSFAALVCLALVGPPVAIAAPDANPGRLTLDLNRGWSYHRGDATEQAAATAYEDNAWESVSLPHTYRLTSLNLDDSDDDMSQPTFHRDLSWYRRALPAFSTTKKRVFLEFEGAHQVTDLWINGRHVGQHVTGGYTPFHFDVTDFVRGDGTDVVALRLDNRRDETVPPDGATRDYILFGGLYRDVRLVVTEELRITFPWEARRAGVRITTPSVTPRGGTVTCETTVENAGDTPRSGRVVSLIADAEGVVVERLETQFEVAPNSTETVVQTGGVYDGVRLWSCDDPYLYRVHTLVEDENGLVDRVANPLGFRWFEFRPSEGFLLNGQPTMLMGTNRHQQFPYLGDAVPNNLHRGDAIRFKRAGMNFVRLAHYPHDDSFLQACDELGLLVSEEAPTWIEFGPPLWWDRLERAQRVMIRNHRNHPCVLGWAGGINHRGPIRRLHHVAKEEDPTRITMSNSTLWTGPQNAGVTDLYFVMDYRGAVVPPGELLLGMEHSGSYDAAVHQKLFSQYRGEPNRIGLALWSAHDGFSFKKRDEQRPNLSRWKASLWDAYRIPKPAFHWYRSELTSEPIVWVPDPNAQPEGAVLVYSNCDEVALQHAGGWTERQAPTRTDDTRYLESPPFVFEVDNTGPVTAVGYNDGVEVARHTWTPAGAPHHLEVAFDTDGFDGVADGSSVLLAYARVCDADGVTVFADTPPVTFTVEGPGEVVGGKRIGANPIAWERGVAPVLVRVGDAAGEIELTASAPGLAPGRVSLRLDSPRSDRIVAPLPTERMEHVVDLGGPEQHMQEGWTPWSVESGTASLFVEDRVGPTVELSVAGDGETNWTTNWGVPGANSFLIEDGVESTGALTLTASGLPDGVYRLRTWHHRVAPERSDAPSLRVTVSDADGADRLAIEEHLPTHGRKIFVTAAGNGGAGDGGANNAWRHPAVTEFRVAGGADVTVRFEATVDGGPVTLNGLELLGEPSPYGVGR